MKTNKSKLGKHQRKMLEFCQKYPGWHSISRADGGFTLKIAQGLVSRNLIHLNQFHQIKEKN